MALAKDPERLREVIKRAISAELGFDGLLWNSMADVADRDFVTETLQWGSILMQHISRCPEDLIYSSREFGFARLADAYSTGSSTPTAWMTVSDSIQIAEGVLATLDTQTEEMKAALDPFMLATDVAYYIVRKDVLFREMHHISGRCVVLSERTGITMNDLSYEQLKTVNERFEEDIAEYSNTRGASR
ncbi:Argininosuccinate lyase [Colletotrichum higginsianum IMI 349063]|uniref:Argininosuccinate lyase n=1 Tax=Colletotrichum higginsianum (strain IMI 349063) TaxID=759273 RepID=A0A1B7XU41_COLHI|nr:Argininosuccinate lyase [Colletotrichum higginsianum IMI 349063]OBR03285.1 Argininosuccinate lyase [Colletotrichum higginsianum IMI 349063]